MRAGWWLVPLALLLLLLSPASPQGGPFVNVSSNLSLDQLIEILASGDLAAGINFTGLTPGSTANNATRNHNASDNNNTSYWIRASPVNTAPLDLCVNASGPLTTGGGENITLAGNYTWNDSATNVSSLPAPPGTDFNATPGKRASTQAIPPGNWTHFRFWLTVPDGQPAGQYTNTVTFKAIAAGNSCG